MGISSQNKNVELSISTPHTMPHHDHDHDQGYLRNSKLNINNINNISDEENDGFKTPTRTENRIAVNYSSPPPAPIKPKTKTMKRRRINNNINSNNKTIIKSFFQVSNEEIKTLFPLLVKDKKPNFATLRSFRRLIMFPTRLIPIKAKPWICVFMDGAEAAKAPEQGGEKSHAVRTSKRLSIEEQTLYNLDLSHSISEL